VNCIRIFSLVAVLGVALSPSAQGSDVRQPADVQKPADHSEQPDQPTISTKETKDTVEGKILTVEDDAYVVREDSGKTVRLYFDKDTNRPNHLVVGDKIMAQVNPLISVAYAMAITKRPAALTAPRVSVGLVSGEVLKMEGQSYWVKEGTGKEVRIFVDDSVLNDLRLNVGDMIFAQVIHLDGKPTRYVVSIKKR
jgi:hypothetical protein